MADGAQSTKRQPTECDLAGQYQKIGISAVAAAVRGESNRNLDERAHTSPTRFVSEFGRDTFEKSEPITREAAYAAHYSYMAASKALVDFSLELIDAAQQNLDGAFDFARQLPELKSPSIFFEVSAGEVLKELENLTRQAQELTSLAQKAVTDTAKCWQSIVELATHTA
jgi:hypothetical protein